MPGSGPGGAGSIMGSVSGGPGGAGMSKKDRRYLKKMSKQRGKQRGRVKEGSAGEEASLVATISATRPSEEYLTGLKGLVEALLLFGHTVQATELQAEVRALLDVVRGNVPPPPVVLGGESEGAGAAAVSDAAAATTTAPEAEKEINWEMENLRFS